MAVDHYENFPVASLLLPRRLRTPVKNLYRFARSADDIADEGDAQPSQRLALLASYRDALQQIGQGRLHLAPDDPRHAVFEPLAQTIRQHALPLQPFFDLLSAFEQDVTTTRYDNDVALFDYCRRSANPVGHLMLHLYEAATRDNLAHSDAICTGLQLTNFWQDVAIDWGKERVYLPLARLNQHGLGTDYIQARCLSALHTPSTNAPGLSQDGHPVHAPIDAAMQPPSPLETTTSTHGPFVGTQPSTTRADHAWQALMRAQVAQAREQLLSGLPLAHRLPGRIGFELKLVVQGGLRILERLDQLHYDIFTHRPTLKKRDWALMVWRAWR
ncbi:squalene synthase HpnC [Alcaligenaceae bacterium]|nr:squalene synthase HpnC [Alcaligenaceae bacterium]